MNRYLTKLAFVGKLRPHQEAAHEKLEANDGIVLHHSTGSGKTLTFLSAAKKALDQNKEERALIVAPASLVTNIDKEIEKHKIKLDEKRLDVYTYEKATKIADQLNSNKYAIAIADEAHRLRNSGTQRTQKLTDVLSSAKKRLLSTGTANYNHVADIAPLLNIAAGSKILPTDRKEFERRYVGFQKKPRSLVQYIKGQQPEKIPVIKNQKSLSEVFSKHIHYYDISTDPKAADKFPEIHHKEIKVEMEEDQKKMYKFLEGQIPFWLRMKIRNNLPLDKQEKAQLNSFSSGVRQVSNSYRPYVKDKSSAPVTPKLREAAKRLEKGLQEDKNFRGLVYSNYLDAGVHDYSDLLKSKGIKHGVFTGSLTAEQKDQLVKDYNSGKSPVLLISSSGAEGLDLKGTKKIQILDPHFNKSKLRQVWGRGARFESHTHLPPEERKVEVEHYLSVHPEPLLGKKPTSIDEYLNTMSDDKDILFDSMKLLMKRNSNLTPSSGSVRKS